jgi:hypothetical protein
MQKQFFNKFSLQWRSSIAARLSFVLIGLYLIFKYAYIWHYHYPSASGGDLYNHYILMTELKEHGIRVFFSGYPKLFHLFVWIGTSITGLPFLKFLLLLTPLIIAAAAYAWSRVAARISGEWAALLTLFVFLFVSAQPHQTLGDGGFPNFIAAGIFLPGFIIQAAQLAEGVTRQRLLKTAGWFLLIVCTHHLTTFYVLLLTFYLLFIFKSRISPKVILGGVTALLLLIISPLGNSVRSIVSLILVPQHSFPWFHLASLNNVSAIWKWEDYGIGISYFVVYVGIPGLIYLFARAQKRREANIVCGLVAILGVFLLVGSQLTVLVFPVRLARDAALPLIIAASCLSVAMIQRLSRYPVLPWLMGIFFLWLASPHLQDSWRRTVQYNEWMEYSNATDEAVQAVNDRPTGAVGQPIATVVKRSIYSISLQPVDLKNTNADIGDYNRSQLGQLEYVFYESRDGAGNWVAPILIQAGFHAVASYQDPLKVVYLYYRSP